MIKIDKNEVNSILANIRKFLQEDNGDIKLVNITEEGIVEVKLLGACAECPLSNMTLRAGVERELMNKIPEIRRVESVN